MNRTLGFLRVLLATLIVAGCDGSSGFFTPAMMEPNNNNSGPNLNPTINPTGLPNTSCQAEFAITAYYLAPTTTDLTQDFFMSGSATSRMMTANGCAGVLVPPQTGFDLGVGQTIDPVNGNVFALVLPTNNYYGMVDDATPSLLHFTFAYLNAQSPVVGCLLDYEIHNGTLEGSIESGPEGIGGNNNTVFILSSTVLVTLTHPTDIDNCVGVLGIF